jgi:hypothetical protein
MLLVQCSDGFHNQPLWYGKLEDGRNWLVQANDGLRLFIEAVRREQASTTLARRVLVDWPIKYGKREFSDEGLFPPMWERTTCYVMELIMRGILPSPNESKARLVEPSLDYLQLCWMVQFRTEDVWRYFQAKPDFLKGALSDFLLEQAITSPFADQRRVRDRLKPQFPDMAKLTLEEALQKYGERVPVTRGRKR